jgi:ABC-type spermidine/putrescine transport system permease subunit II
VHRGILIIFVPAIIVGISYIAMFRWLGYEVGLAPFVGTAFLFACGLAGVWRYQRQRGKRKN